MNKFGNRETHCFSRHLHDSKLEAGYCNRLLAMKQKGEIIDFKVQVPFPIKVNGRPICDHVVDFLVHRSTQAAVLHNWEVHEAKGYRTAVWSLKLKLFQACYSDIPYIIINLSKRRPVWLKSRKIKMILLSSRR